MYQGEARHLRPPHEPPTCGGSFRVTKGESFEYVYKCAHKRADYAHEYIFKHADKYAYKQTYRDHPTCH